MSFDDDQPGAHHIERMTVERRFDRGVPLVSVVAAVVEYRRSLTPRLFEVAA